VKLSERALERDSDNFDALIVLGRVELARGHWKSSMEHAQRAVAAQPNNVGALHLLAQAHFRLGQKELAAAAADRRDGVQSRRDSIAKLAMMIAYRPDDPKLHLLMGQLAVETGQSVLAEQSYRAALAIDPRSGPAASGLARLRARSAATSSAPHDQDGARLSSGFIANRRP
jgi:cytochrome c-type biogenesis protein CcmH/NrfG